MSRRRLLIIFSFEVALRQTGVVRARVVKVRNIIKSVLDLQTFLVSVDAQRLVQLGVLNGHVITSNVVLRGSVGWSVFMISLAIWIIHIVRLGEWPSDAAIEFSHLVFAFCPIDTNHFLRGQAWACLKSALDQLVVSWLLTHRTRVFVRKPSLTGVADTPLPASLIGSSWAVSLGLLEKRVSFLLPHRLNIWQQLVGLEVFD